MICIAIGMNYHSIAIRRSHIPRPLPQIYLASTEFSNWFVGASGYLLYCGTSVDLRKLN